MHKHSHDHKKCGCCSAAAIISGILFAIIAIVHLLRGILGWSIIVNGSEMPMWCSWVTFIIAVFMAIVNFGSCCCKCCHKCCKKECSEPPVKTP